MNKRWLLWFCWFLLLAAGCGEQTVSPSPGVAERSPEQQIIGTWQVYNDPSSSAKWIFAPNNAVYIEQAQTVYEERTYEFGDDGRQLAIKAGETIDFYSFTLDANQLSLVDRATNTTTFFQKLSDSVAKPEHLR